MGSHRTPHAQRAWPPGRDGGALVTWRRFHAASQRSVGCTQSCSKALAGFSVSCPCVVPVSHPGVPSATVAFLSCGRAEALRETACRKGSLFYLSFLRTLPKRDLSVAAQCGWALRGQAARAVSSVDQGLSPGCCSSASCRGWVPGGSPPTCVGPSH